MERPTFPRKATSSWYDTKIPRWRAQIDEKPCDLVAGQKPAYRFRIETLVLDLDHISGDKVKDISRMTYNGFPLEEIKKKKLKNAKLSVQIVTAEELQRGPTG